MMAGRDPTPIHDAFGRACESERLKLRAGNTTDSAIFKQFVFDHLDEERGGDSKGIGYWTRTRVLDEFLGRLQWTANTIQNHFYDLCETESPNRDLSPRRFAGLVEGEANISKFEGVLPVINRFKTDWDRRIWSQLAIRSFQGKPALELGARKFLTDYYVTPAAFKEKLNQVLKVHLRRRTDVVVDNADFQGVPTFAAEHVSAQQCVVEDLIDFIRDGDGPPIGAIAGEAATGKSGIFQEVIRKLYIEGEQGGERHVICLNVSQLRNFDIILSRLNYVTRGILACEVQGSPVQLAEESYEQPLEMNIHGFTENIRQSKKGVLFFFTDVEALVFGKTDGSPYRLQEERLNWLTRIITESGARHKVILGLLPVGDFTPSASDDRVIAYIQPPGIKALRAFTSTFPGASGLEQKVKLALEGGRRNDVLKSTVIIAAMSLHKMAEQRADINDTAVNRVIAASKRSPDGILQEILRLIEPDKRALVTMVFLALSPDGIRRDTLVKFLRYHREYSRLLRKVPANYRILTRKALTADDLAFLKDFEAEHSILVSRYAARPRFRDNEGLRNDASETLYITTGLRSSMEKIIEVSYPELAELAHRLLAKIKRRVSMRARLANTKPHGKTLEEVQSDFDVATHLLAAVRISAGKLDRLRRLPRMMNAKELERRVFTRPRGRPVEIVSFVLSELIQRDTQLGYPEKMSNAWITDEAILTLLLKFFHFGGPALRSAGDEPPELLSRIPESLSVCLQPNDLVWLVTAVARTAWRLQDFQLLRQALALESSLVALGAGAAELQSLDLLRLDYLIGTGALRHQDGNSANHICAETYAIQLLKEHGGFNPAPGGKTEDVLSDLHSKARRAARAAVKQLDGDSNRLTFRIRVLARLGELYDLTDSDGDALRAFFEAEEIDRIVPNAGFTVLSGDIGRKFVKAMIRLAVTSYDEHPNVFAWAKAKAEDVHRRNIERISVFPAERTEILIDEALLERHVRGDVGRGDLKLSRDVLSGDRAEMAALTAPRVARLEYLLERAKGAMLLFKHQHADQAEEGLRDLDLIEDLLLSSGAEPPFIEREADRTRVRLEPRQTNDGEHDPSDEEDADRSMLNAGYRIDQLVDCVASGDAGPENKSSDGPILI